MTACWTGYWPEVGPYGEPLTGRRKQMAGMKLCDGFYFVLWALIGDLDYLTKTYLLPNATSNKPCCWCPCNSDNVPWWDFRIKAKWVQKVWTREAWEVSGWKQCPIFNIPGVSLLSVYPDWMHIKTLGIDKVLLGSTLWVLIHWIVPESLGDLECRLAFVWGEIFEEYERQGTKNRYTVIKLSMFTTKSTPKLKGKAAEVKDLGPVLLAVFRRLMNKKLWLHRQIEIMLRGSAHCDSLLEEQTDVYALPQSVAADLISTGFSYLAVWSGVAQYFRGTYDQLFGLTAKAHLLMHCCILSRSVYSSLCGMDRGLCNAG